jgi:hypothetical protein
MNKEIVNGVSPVESTIVAAPGGSPTGRGALVHDRLGMDGREATALPEESLFIDERCDQSPAVLVESKLTRLLGGGMLPVSHLQTRGLLRQR